MSLKIKIVTGFRRDQEHTIDAEEAHKAYHLFLNPEKRAIFSNGLAIKGSDITKILPDYHATMGWHEFHNIDEYDLEEIKIKGIDVQLRNVLVLAKNVAVNAQDEKVFALPLSKVPERLLLK